MANNSPGWAVELIGDKFDLDDFQLLLARPFDPWMENYLTDDGSKSLLRSASWAKLTEAADVFRDANRMIERLNGEALLIYNDARPVKLGQTIRFGPDGRREPIIFAATGHLRVTLGRVRARVTAVTCGPTQEPQELRMQKWFREAEMDDTRAELFTHLNRADNWYDVYKSMELTKRLAGGSLRATLGSDLEEWKRVWWTANCNRHAPDPVKYPLPIPPVELEEARDFILKVIPRVL